MQSDAADCDARSANQAAFQQALPPGALALTLARISLAYLRRHKVGTALNVALLAFGLAVVTLVLLTSSQLEKRIQRDARDIDLVVGAKGSPTQIVLSSVYDLDVPTGSVAWSAVEEISRLPGVKAAIPIVLGDNYFGARIVGTNASYLDHYGARLQEGRLWQEPLEAVLGADVAARMRPPLGSTFGATHGIPARGGELHGDYPYRIVGVLGRTGALVDQVVVTDVASYWKLHPDKQTVDTGLVSEPSPDGGRTVSALLIKYASAAAADEVKAFVSDRGDLEAASPAQESGRLLGIVALNIDLLRGFSIVMLIAAALSIFIALYNGLNERRYDIAVMRTLGATREDVMSLLLFEGLLLALVGAVVGLLLGHLLTSILGYALRRLQQISVTGWTWQPDELWIVVLALFIGALASLLPAWRARDIDIAGTLARG